MPPLYAVAPRERSGRAASTLHYDHATNPRHTFRITNQSPSDGDGRPFRMPEGLDLADRTDLGRETSFDQSVANLLRDPCGATTLTAQPCRSRSEPRTPTAGTSPAPRSCAHPHSSRALSRFDGAKGGAAEPAHPPRKTADEKQSASTRYDVSRSCCDRAHRQHARSDSFKSRRCEGAEAAKLPPRGG